MSEWITDRRPTIDDCKYSKKTLHREYVWVTYNNRVTWLLIEEVKLGCPWQPIVIERPEPYVAPKSEPKYVVMKDIYYTDLWAVYNGSKYVADGLPTREAAERIAAIYNEVME